MVEVDLEYPDLKEALRSALRSRPPAKKHPETHGNEPPPEQAAALAPPSCVRPWPTEMGECKGKLCRLTPGPPEFMYI